MMKLSERVKEMAWQTLPWVLSAGVLAGSTYLATQPRISAEKRQEIRQSRIAKRIQEECARQGYDITVSKPKAYSVDEKPLIQVDWKGQGYKQESAELIFYPDKYAFTYRSFSGDDVELKFDEDDAVSGFCFSPMRSMQINEYVHKDGKWYLQGPIGYRPQILLEDHRDRDAFRTKEFRTKECFREMGKPSKLAEKVRKILSEER